MSRSTGKTRFAGQVVVITGASSGIGLATARVFAGEGAHLVLAARHRDKLQQAATELASSARGRILSVGCDVSQRPQVDDLFATTVAELGRIDVLVNNAGTGITAPAEIVPLADAKALWETNFFGPFNCCQAVLPHLKRQGSGRIVNVASLAGLRGVPNTSIYSAAKAGLIALSDALRIEVRPLGISVTVICLSRVRLADTAFFQTSKKYGPVALYKIPSHLSADKVARVLVDATARRKRMVVIPLHARLLHTLNKMAPTLVDRILYWEMPRLPVPGASVRP